MNHLIDILQLSTQEIDELVEKATDIIANPEAYAHKCDGKILATLFFEPSTRTRLSFESAMLSLGGKTLGFSSASSSSAAKGESVADTVRTSYVKNEVIKKNSIPYEQTTDLESVMPELDILYMTRVQRERFFNEEDYLRLKDSYILTPEKLKTAKQDLCIMHPLPRVNEISVAVDDDPRACYFKQVRNGRYIRMALIMKMLGIE